MATFVLVHGAWHGGWCWRRTTEILRAKGHRVFEPTLSGVGARAHEATAAIGVYTHANDVAGLVEMEQINDIILVGHSYGGMVITAAAEQIAPRIGVLVYLDAFVPKSGESLMMLVGPERGQNMLASAMQHGEGWRVPAPPPSYFGVKKQDDIDWITSRCTPQSLLTFMQPVRSAKAAEDVKRKVYIRAEGHPGPTFAPFGEMAKSTPGWDYHAVACGHEVMIEMPNELAEILLKLA